MSIASTGASKSEIVHNVLNEALPSILFSNTLSSFFPPPPAIIISGLGFENLVA